MRFHSGLAVNLPSKVTISCALQCGVLQAELGQRHRQRRHPMEILLIALLAGIATVVHGFCTPPPQIIVVQALSSEPISSEFACLTLIIIAILALVRLDKASSYVIKAVSGILNSKRQDLADVERVWRSVTLCYHISRFWCNGFGSCFGNSLSYKIRTLVRYCKERYAMYRNKPKLDLCHY